LNLWSAGTRDGSQSAFSGLGVEFLSNKDTVHEANVCLST